MGFAAAVSAVVLVVVLAVMPEMAVAAVYKVGDAAGWTIIGGVDYKQWAATKTFQLGDVIGNFPINIIIFLFWNLKDLDHKK